MSDVEFARDYVGSLADVLPQLDATKLGEAIRWLRETRDSGRMIYICGNGGSASIASQMVVDVVKGASFGREQRYRMLALTDSLSTLTAYANDEGYETVFVEPLRNFAQPGDVLIAISGSGNSRNVLRAVEYANSAGCRTIGLTTAEGGQLKDLVQLAITVPTSHMGRLEDCFFIATHVMCYALMQ
jgi:D-sedoheptulose 7-phosphate isomerase